jgi:hypothetical protein
LVAPAFMPNIKSLTTGFLVGRPRDKCLIN